MLQIGAFSKVCQVSVKTLRHYDSIGLLRPAEVDAFTGYRYYAEEQIDRMNYIQRLKRYGFSLEEIARLLDVSDQTELLRALRERQEQLTRDRRETDVILRELQTHISVFERTGDMMTYQKNYTVSIKESPALSVLASRRVMSVDDFGRCYGALFERVAREHLTPTGLTGSRYFDETFDHDASDIEVFIGVREEDRADQTLPAQTCAMTVHRGGYSTLNEAYGAVVRWIAEKGYEIAGAPFDLYVRSRFDAPSPEDWETEVWFPVVKK